MAHIADPEDILSDAHDTMEDDQFVDHPGAIEEVEVSTGIESDVAVQRVKISTPDQGKGDNSPMHSSRGASISTSLEQPSDAASVQSLPAVLVTEPHSVPRQRPATARTTESPSTDPRPPPSPSQSPTTQEEGILAQQQRRARHRTTADTRSSNRLSGFFTNLIHRRDNQTNGTTRNAIREDPPAGAPGQTSETQSRASSPAPGRPVTPPPPLPAPTLQELGLSLSVLTADLSPSHFSTPPSSGAFLAPHYLLLCHAQGLDVLPLVSPPARQPYALVRRVNFKSVVVMEQRGVLVAIAGRRDGVRVYALEEVKKAIEWRMEMEVRRERDRSRREVVKKMMNNSIDSGNHSRESAEKTRKGSLSTPPPGDPVARTNVLRKSSYDPVPIPPVPTSTPPAPLIPRSPTPRTPKKPRNPQIQIPTQIPEPTERPPPYSSPSELTHPPRLQRQPSSVSLNPRSRSGSVSNVLAAAPRNSDSSRPHDPDAKADWAESSDEEAIDIVAAGSSGSQALDERTSATLSAHSASVQAPSVAVRTTPPRTSMSSTRRNRPSNLDLSLSRSNTLALSQSPPSLENNAEAARDPETPSGAVEDDDDDGDDGISLAQILLESRLPDLPPLGSRRPQQPIWLSSSEPNAPVDGQPASPRTSEGHDPLNRPPTSDGPQRRRRRWSTLLSGLSMDANEPISSSAPTVPSTAPLSGDRPTNRFSRSQSFRSNHSQASTIRPSSSPNEPTDSPTTATPPDMRETTPSVMSSQSSRSSRFIPRILSNAFHSRRSEERPALPASNVIDTDSIKRTPATPLTPHAPPPKLEYVKLPGTKGALMVKAVETAKKSFLAILCGENGEKVELFAGTYRTALGLSRTFILPDSPRSLELQLQGDDLVEVFLVFSQNVFGLEPATVRVREVRIGRAERRAARRRAREVRAGETSNNGSEAALVEEDTNTNVNVSIGVSVAVGSTVVATDDGTNRSSSPTLIPNEHPEAQQESTDAPADAATSSAVQHHEELVTVATAQMGPYTTFQQLGFAPKFPLASIADEYIIPPTYPSFLEYRAKHEPEEGSSTDLSQIQFSPPGLPVPVPTAPCRWFYRDPKGVVHGPWKASLMQAWYKDGLLPPDLPVRREEEDTYMLLKDLRLQSVDPTHPFKSPPPRPAPTTATAPNVPETEKPLLPPISLLAQPRHFGPPRCSSHLAVGIVRRLWMHEDDQY
ncbi:putative GYF domain containing protein [Lyophyllum shimeji]|uniref:GYF domain containing protein n=1 Tax=Lyophyllum shimeji TaxID=47721 RepID=A0A9P3PJ14_LYOSH|nr:putative GYF domain containing protein [Lyophyllum shimeji]